MTNDQIREAVEQMKVHCNLMMASYEMVSARGTLYTLGYHGDDAEAVLQALFDGGFTYCLDSHYHVGAATGISQDVCHFGPDQLKDRLDSVRL